MSDDTKADRKGPCHQPQKTGGMYRPAVPRGYPTHCGQAWWHPHLAPQCLAFAGSCLHHYGHGWDDYWSDFSKNEIAVCIAQGASRSRGDHQGKHGVWDWELQYLDGNLPGPGSLLASQRYSPLSPPFMLASNMNTRPRDNGTHSALVRFS